MDTSQLHSLPAAAVRTVQPVQPREDRLAREREVAATRTFPVDAAAATLATAADSHRQNRANHSTAAAASEKKRLILGAARTPLSDHTRRTFMKSRWLA